MRKTFWLSAVAALSVTLSAAAEVTASVDLSGRFLIDAPGYGWSFGGQTGAAVSELQTTEGADGIGPYSEISFRYTMEGVPREAAIRTYNAVPVVLFSETFLGPGPNSGHFPRLDTYPRGLHVFGYGSWEYWFEAQAIEPGSPWVFFDSAGKSFVLSPASNFIVARIASVQDGLEAQLDPAIPTLSQGFTHRTMLALGNGINRAFDTWGRALTDLAGKVRPPSDADVTLRRAGYWTDNGAPYYYNPGDDGKNLLEVHGDCASKGIRFGYFQMDSWWYLKGVPPSWRSVGHGIYRLRTDPELFPEGLGGFQQQLGVPLVTHSRYWSAQSPDRAEYSFSGNVPVDPRYWRDLAAYLADSGVKVYEQDWLSGPAATAVNVDDPEAFFTNMAAAMAEKGITLQYCMPRPRHFLQGSKYSNLTSIRASADRFGRGRWDVFLFNSRLASALGIWPFTDNFRSANVRDVLLATLSAGPLAPSDEIGRADAANLRRALRADGLIVKPDAPLVPTDDTYIALAENRPAPMVASTYTDFGGLGARYVYAYDRAEGGASEATFSPAVLGISPEQFPRSYVYDFFAGTGKLVDTSGYYTATVDGNGTYFIVVPMGASGMAMLGDDSKFASLGRQRVSSLSDDGEVLTATLELARNERSGRLLLYSPSAPLAWTDGAGVTVEVVDAAAHLYRIRVYGQAGTITVFASRHQAPPADTPPTLRPPA